MFSDVPIAMQPADTPLAGPQGSKKSALPVAVEEREMSEEQPMEAGLGEEVWTIRLRIQHGETRYLAEREDWPGLSGAGWDAVEALDDLAAEIEGARPLSDGVVDVLTSRGGEILRCEWDRLIRGWRCSHLRISRRNVEAALSAFGAEGFDSVEACHWISTGASAQEAATARNRGLSVVDFEAYLDEYWAANHDLSWMEQKGVMGPLVWIEAGIPVDRALAYEREFITPSQAADQWEPLVNAAFIDGGRLETYLRAGLSLDTTRMWDVEPPRDEPTNLEVPGDVGTVRLVYVEPGEPPL